MERKQKKQTGDKMETNVESGNFCWVRSQMVMRRFPIWRVSELRPVVTARRKGGGVAAQSYEEREGGVHDSWLSFVAEFWHTLKSWMMRERMQETVLGGGFKAQIIQEQHSIFAFWHWKHKCSKSSAEWSRQVNGVAGASLAWHYCQPCVLEATFFLDPPGNITIVHKVWSIPLMCVSMWIMVWIGGGAFFFSFWGGLLFVWVAPGVAQANSSQFEPQWKWFLLPQRDQNHGHFIWKERETIIACGCIWADLKGCNRKKGKDKDEDI